MHSQLAYCREDKKQFLSVQLLIRALVILILAEWLVNLFADFKRLIYEHRYVWV